MAIVGFPLRCLLLAFQAAEEEHAALSLSLPLSQPLDCSILKHIRLHLQSQGVSIVVNPYVRHDKEGHAVIMNETLRKR